MLFNSYEFLIFFPLVCAIYFLLRTQKSRMVLLFVSSCFFYGFFIPAYLLILFAVIGIDFVAAQKIEGTENSQTRKFFLIVSLIANLSILAFFKYANFMIDNWNGIGQALHWQYSIETLKIVLPIGLSFHTFQSMSYVIEVYFRRYKAERNLLTYSVYVLYFPQLVAGPIERPQNILSQLHQDHAFDYSRTVSGLYLIAQGLIKKCVVADALAPLANQIFDSPPFYGTLATFVGVVAFTFQIYCDFSGYSDIARGTSRIFGIELMVNFNKPYFARSISEFWRRWHISLSTWFRDYLYIPLGGNRKGKLRMNLNLLIVFAVSGLWHGANWTFVIWGLLHGTFLLTENLIIRPLGRIYVFVLVSFGWIFFRAANVTQAVDVIKGFSRPFLLGFNSFSFEQVCEVVILVGSLLLIEAIDERKEIWKNVREWNWAGRWSFYWAVILIFLFLGHFSGTQFIYFQF